MEMSDDELNRRLCDRRNWMRRVLPSGVNCSTYIGTQWEDVGYSTPNGPPHGEHPDCDWEQLVTTPEDSDVSMSRRGWNDFPEDYFDDTDIITEELDIYRYFDPTDDDAPPLTGGTGASTDVANSTTATATTTPEQPQLQAQANDDHNNHNDHNEDTDHQTAAMTSATTTTMPTTKSGALPASDVMSLVGKLENRIKASVPSPPTRAHTEQCNRNSTGSLPACSHDAATPTPTPTGCQGVTPHVPLTIGTTSNATTPKKAPPPCNLPQNPPTHKTPPRGSAPANETPPGGYMPLTQHQHQTKHYKAHHHRSNHHQHTNSY